jgi:2-isopropylmalate synthase
LPRRAYILDTTLRDGEQTPGVSLTSDEKVEIAKKVSELGVDVIEAGFPIASEGEYEAVKRIAGLGLSSKVAALARANRKDIELAVSTGAQRVHVFIATSDIHMKYKLKMTREEVLNAIREWISYVRDRGLEVEFSAEDSTRSERGFLIQAFKTAASSGAKMLDIADTVGTASPQLMTELVTQIKREIPNAGVSVHCHNDF